MSNGYARSKASELYSKLEKLIHHTVKKFHKRFGGDYEELLSIAHYKFMKALETWKPDRGALTTRVRQLIWYGLLDHINRPYLNGSRVSILTGTTLSNLPSKQRFDLEKVMSEVSPDAREVVRRALRSSKSGTQNKKRAALAEALLDLGWAAQRVLEAFREVQEALMS